MSRRKNQPGLAERVYRHTVEIRDLRDGTVRHIPLRGYVAIQLKTGNSSMGRKSPARPEPMPNAVPKKRQYWKLEDDLHGHQEITDAEDLKVRVRERYPDEFFERRLIIVRDREAEERHASAMRGLLQIIAESAVDRYCKELGRPVDHHHLTPSVK